jgi:hypothetical protein
MSCPICGANCRCKKAGPGGICCSCHRHKARKVLESIPLEQSNEIREALARHIRDIEREESSRLFRENGDGA